MNINTQPNLIFIDSLVADYQSILANIPPGTPVHQLDNNSHGLEQITEILASYRDLTALHIISHGSNGQLLLGSGVLNGDNLDQYKGLLSAWRLYLGVGANILLYGCMVAEDSQGEKFVKELATITGAWVAASDDLTGNPQLGGDAELEFTTGNIGHEQVELVAQLMGNYAGVLQDVTATITNDTIDGDTSNITALIADPGVDGGISLREAVIASNNTAGADQIILQDGQQHTLSISGTDNTAQAGDLDISDTVTITAATTNGATVDAAGIDRVFEVSSNGNLSLENLVVTGGNVGYGGGGGITLFNGGTLAISNSTITGNTATSGAAFLGGGGIHANNATVTVSNSTITGNTANYDGGGVLIQYGTLAISNSTITGNTANDDGGGIWADRTTVTVSNSTISSNTATADGGGVLIQYGTVAFNSST
ncbi:MAG: DUF4347 domain-containing protein, partial [Microcoleaceae cyanobacterium]